LVFSHPSGLSTTTATEEEGEQGRLGVPNPFRVGDGGEKRAGEARGSRWGTRGPHEVGIRGRRGEGSKSVERS